MSEAVTMALITNVAIIVSALISKWDRQKIAKKMDDNTRVTNEVKTELGVVKTQTDGIKDELVQKTKELGEAIGKALGRAEQKSETDAHNKGIVSDSEEPLKVEVVNEPLQVIPPKNIP